ncbi:MAG: serine hydrolase domain-containing protein [Bacteroidota bacterium]
MSPGKILKRSVLTIVVLLIAYAVYYCWQAFPIISGYGAKNICSCVMIAGRNPGDVIKNELGNFPLKLGSFTVDYEDSSATASVFGLAKRKAIYRKGLGCSLLVELTEEEFRNQKTILASPPAVNQDTIAWPFGNLLSTIDSPQVNDERLKQVLADAFSEPGPDKLRRTRAVVVVYDGKIVAEQYAPGFNQNSKLIGWSMTKSITNALVGILVKQGKLNLDSPATVPLWTDARHNITLNDLMHASSGLSWEENYGGPSGATNMLFKKKDMGVYAADVPLVDTPGEKFYYSSGTTNIISRIVRETVGDENYYRFPYEQLFYKIGMLNTVIEPDAGGTFVGSSYSFGYARDWARFGLLYLNDGVWNGERILPEGWVKYTTTPAKGADRGQYGAQFWLNAGAPNNISNRYYPDVPNDMYWADGFEGQNVFIIPSKKLVVVKLSLSQGDYLDDNKFLAEIIDALPQ